MGLINLFHKEKTNNEKDGINGNNAEIEKKDLLSIPCDYDGYELFDTEYMDLKLFSEINAIITNGRFDLDALQEYGAALENKGDDLLGELCEAWLDRMHEEDFLVYLDEMISMKDFVERVNSTLNRIGAEVSLDVTGLTEEYRNELEEYSLKGKKISSEINYDVLQSNLAAKELRKYGYELICLFDGFDNNDKAIIPVDKIEAMKAIEEKINERA